MRVGRRRPQRLYRVYAADDLLRDEPPRGDLPLDDLLQDDLLQDDFPRDDFPRDDFRRDDLLQDEPIRDGALQRWRLPFGARSAAIAGLVVAVALVGGTILASGPRSRVAGGEHWGYEAAAEPGVVAGARRAPASAMPSAIPSAVRVASGRARPRGSGRSATTRRRPRVLASAMGSSGTPVRTEVGAPATVAGPGDRPAGYPAQSLAVQRATSAPVYTAAVRRTRPEFGFER